MEKILRIGTIQIGGRRGSVYCKVSDKDNYISFTGVIAPLPSGNALGGCGQIDMEFEHKNPKDNDTRYSNRLIKAVDIKFAKGWNKKNWFEFLDNWKQYHLKNCKESAIYTYIKGYVLQLPETDKIPAWC